MLSTYLTVYTNRLARLDRRKAGTVLGYVLHHRVLYLYHQLRINLRGLVGGGLLCYVHHRSSVLSSITIHRRGVGGRMGFEGLALAT